MEDLLKPSIVVKPHPPNLSVKPRCLQPLMLLPREHLQLSFLDLASPFGTFESSRSFESSIKILDLEGRVASQPVVLIARLESDKTLYVLERQKNGLYTLCHLGFWVDLEVLGGLATVCCSRLIKKRPGSSADSGLSRPLTTPQLHHENKKRRLAIEAIQSLVKKPPRSRSVSAPSQAAQLTTPPTPVADNIESQSGSTQAAQDVALASTLDSQARSRATEVPNIDEAPAVTTENDIFDNIRNQYSEALYYSMGSLAYFAKGPLSRARAAFHLDCDSNLEMNDLIDFLKSLIMTTVQIDKKYRGTIPDIISKMKPTFQDSDVEQGTAKNKKRKSKKMKLGKDGLYPMEDGHIRKWWNTHKPQPKDDESRMETEAQETKLLISCLRSRETQLQMIIILEVLALESTRTSGNDKDSQLPGLPSNRDTEEISKDIPIKKRNRHNLPFLLDVHADRLCIWHSTALDDVKMLDDSQASKGPEAQKSLRATSDPLKDFCVDIIVPFFSARLPEQCDAINRKLGGPVMMPPPKSIPKKSETVTKSKAKSGTAVKRPPPPKSSKSLENVLSKETEKHRRSMSRGPSGVIALMRSASTPVLKREASEPLSTMNIPKVDSAVSQDKTFRSSVSTSVKRRSGDEKAKKEALIKAELQDAITALRRPNRDVVGKAMAEAAERRATTSLSQMRKSRKPTQHPQFLNIVKATPVSNRFRDAFAKDGGNRSTHPREMQSIEEDPIPPSSSLIPSSAPRKRTAEVAFGVEASPVLPKSTLSADLIQATPARRPTPKQGFLSVTGVNEASILASSPMASRRSSLKLSATSGGTLGHHDSGIGMPTSPIDELIETPMKPRLAPGSLEGFVTVTPAKRRTLDSRESATSVGRDTTENREGGGRKLSIYERLGWNDDFDELG
ncbi:DNA replication regulator SLD3-domain-containing protein [Xylariaceae sp. FL0662B]|nr:DNA replication regulator SLD3-domain-containing protein [Xylariaceae sp. FL0662B]